MNTNRTPRSGPKPRVLIVDDNRELRRFLQLKLEAEGFEVDIRASGDAALPMLDPSIRYDVVITDQDMPGTIQGSDLLREIKKRAPKIPVVIITGNTDQWGPDAPAPADAEVILEKPFTLDDLTRIVRDLLRARGFDS